MRINKHLSRKQFAAAVVKQLGKDDILAVLVGGACVSIYTNDKHKSKDLDFISPDSVAAITESLAKIGFDRNGRYYVHPDSELYLEFPSGPIGIGNQVPVQPEGKITVSGIVIKMLSPTQSVMDRLAWFFSGDRQSLIHAIWICERQPVNLSKVTAWARKQGYPEKHQEFLETWKLAKARKRKVRKSKSKESK